MTQDVIIEEPERKSNLSQRWQKGQSGNPAGRTPGIRQPLDVRDRCEALGCDPFRILAMIANGDYEGLMVNEASITLQSRLKAATELASYLAPKLKSIEVQNGDKDEKTVMIVQLPTSGRENTQKVEQQVAEVISMTPDAMTARIYNNLDEDDENGEGS